jgi:hypothetical protein
MATQPVQQDQDAVHEPHREREQEIDHA